MSHFCHLKPRLTLYHSFVLRIWPNWYSQLNVLNPTAFTQLRQFWAHFVQVNSVGCWMMAANWAMRVPLTGSGREVLLTVQCSWARLEWTGKDDAGGRREAGGRPLNTRTAEQVVDVRSPTTVIDVFPPFFPTGFAWLCRRDCDSVWLVCLARRRISREPLTSDSLGCRANVHLTAFWCETSVEAVKRTHVSLTCQRLFKIGSKPAAE